MRLELEELDKDKDSKIELPDDDDLSPEERHRKTRQIRTTLKAAFNMNHMSGMKSSSHAESLCRAQVSSKYSMSV